MNVKPLDAYRKYVALKLHFNSEKYDYFSAKGAVRIKQETFDKRNDQYKFKKLAKIHTPESLEKLVVANLLHDKETWVGDLLGQEARDRMLKRQKVEQSLSYVFCEDLNFLIARILLDKEQIFAITEDGVRPGLLKYAMQGQIQLESYIIIMDILHLQKKYEKVLKDDIIWQDFNMKCLKYKPFLKYDRERMFNLLKENIKRIE